MIKPSFCPPFSAKKSPNCYAKPEKPYKLSIQMGNAKLPVSVATFSLPAGFSCPFAKECLSKANRLTGHIIDGEHCQYRCFAASQECSFPSVRKSRWANFELLKDASTIKAMANLIQQSIPYGTSFFRIHVSGDYFNEKYFLAWLNVAMNNPFTVFYGYTKALPWIVKYKKLIPPNFRLTASKGGTHDHLIGKHHLKFAEVVHTELEAKKKGLEIDHDDSHAMQGNQSFALLLHGTQPEGSLAGEALKLLRREDKGGYSKKKKNSRMKRKVDIFVDILPQNKSLFFVPKSNGWRTLGKLVFRH